MSGSLILILIVCLAAGLAFIRLAPSSETRWHVLVKGAQDSEGSNSALRVLSADDGMMMRMHEAIMKLPRTAVLAGDPAKGSVTYIVRSKLIGFPDYVTMEQTGHMLKLFSRSRFGKSDLGVNARRLDGLIAAVKAR